MKNMSYFQYHLLSHFQCEQKIQFTTLKTMLHTDGFNVHYEYSILVCYDYMMDVAMQ